MTKLTVQRKVWQSRIDGGFCTHICEEILRLRTTSISPLRCLFSNLWRPRFQKTVCVTSPVTYIGLHYFVFDTKSGRGLYNILRNRPF